MPQRGVQAMEVAGQPVRVHSAGDAGPGVVIFHAWWGLDGDVTADADRLAAEGFRALAPDRVRGRIANASLAVPRCSS